MLKIENWCVDCGFPCLRGACKNYNVHVYYCDQCKEACAEFRIDGEDYCEDCAKEYIKDIFDELYITEQAKILEISLQHIDDVLD